jgi:hypothetical protein
LRGAPRFFHAEREIAAFSTAKYPNSGSGSPSLPTRTGAKEAAGDREAPQRLRIGAHGEIDRERRHGDEQDDGRRHGQHP